MANTESSFSDRLQRGHELQAALAGFSPAFDPADPALAPAAFAVFLTSLGTMNTAVAAADADWKDSAATRAALVTEIKDRALRANSRVKSNSAWKAQQPAVKAAADALRGYRPAAPKAAADPAATKPAATRSKTDQSYGDVKLLLDKLIAALARVPAYDTAAPVDISSASLEALSNQLDGFNKMVAGKEQALAAIRGPRNTAYDEDLPNAPCLKSRMLGAKEATKSQYGSTSGQYAQVKGIKV